MLDQLDQMQVTTPASTFPSSSPTAYAIGPIDSSQFTTLQAHLTTGEECSFLIPIHMPISLFIDPLFKDGYECGYLDGEVEAEWSIPHLVNWTYNTLNDDLYNDQAWNELGLHLPAWMVGWVIGNLAWLAKTERTPALVGLAHLCFLLPFLTLDAPFWPPYSLRRADFLHRQVLCAYRKQIRIYRKQGRSFVEAQGLALAASA